MTKTSAGTTAGSRSPDDAGMSEGAPESSKKSATSPNGSQTRRSTSPSAKNLRRGLSSVSVRASKKTGTSSPRASRQSRGVARLASAVKKTSSYRFSEKQLESKFGSGSEQSAAQLKSLNSRVMDALGEIGMPVLTLTPEPATAAFPRSFSTSAEKRSTMVTERITDRAVGPGESSDDDPVELVEHDVERAQSVGGVGAELSQGQGGSSSVQTLPPKSGETWSQTQAKDDSRLMSSTVSLLQAVPSPGDMDAATLMVGPGGPRSASDNDLRGERLPTTQVEVPRSAGKEVFLRYKKKRKPDVDAVVNFGSTARAALENALQRRLKYSAPWTTRSPASSSTEGATAAAFSWASAPVLRAIRQPALEMLQLQSLFLEQLALEPSATSPEHTREAAVLVRRLLHPATRVESALALRQSYLPLSSTTSAVLCERVVAQLAKFGAFISDQVAAAAGAAPGEDQAGNVKPGEQARARAATGIMWLRAAQESLQLLRQHFDAKTRRKTALGGELRRCLENVRAWCLEADAFSAAEQENVVGSHLPRRVSVAPSRILYRSVAAEARAVAGVARLRECAELRVGPVRAALDTLDRVVARKQQLWQAAEPFMNGLGTTLSSTVSGKGTTPAKSSAGASSTSEVKITSAPGDGSGSSAASAGLVKTASPPDQDEEPLAPVFPRLRSAVQGMFAVSELRAPENPGSRTLDPPGASTVRFLRDCTTIPVFLDGNDFANALLFGDPLYTEKTARDQRAGYESSLYSRGTGSDLTLRSAVGSQLERAGRDQNVAEGQVSEAAPYVQGRSLAARMGSVGSSQLALTEGDEFFDDSGIHMAAILGKRRLRNQGGKEMNPEEEQHATALEEQVVLLAVTNGPEVQVSPQINAEESSKEQEAVVTSSPLGQGVGPAAPQAVYERSHAGEDETHDDEFDVEDLALTADESLASRLILARLHDRGCRAHGIEVRLGVRRVTRRIVARGLIQQAWAMLLGLVSEVARYAQRQEVEKAAAAGPSSSGPAPEKENASSAIAGGDSRTKIVSLSAAAGAAEIRSLVVRRLNSIVRIFKTECVHMQRALFPVQHHHDELEHAVLAHFVEEAVPEREWPPDVYERYTLLSNCHSVDFFSMLDDFEAFFPEQGGQLVRILSGVEGFLRFDKDERWFAEVGAESCGIWDAEDASGLKQRSALDAMLEEEAEMVAGKNPTSDDAASSAKQDSTASRPDKGDADTSRMTTLLKQVVEGNLPANDPGSPSRRNLDLRQKVEMMKAEVQLLRVERQRETEEREKREAEARLLRMRVGNEVQKGMEEEAWLYGGKDIPVGLARPWQKGAYVRRACHPPAVSTIGWIVARLHHHQHHHDDVEERAVDVRYADGKVVRFPIPTKEEDISKMSAETALVPVKVGVFVSGLPTSTTLWRHPVNGRYDQIFFSATHTNSPAVFRNGHAVIFLHTCGKGAAAHNYWVMTSNLHACEALLEDQESVLADDSSQALRKIMETSRGLIWGFHAAAEKDIFPRPEFVWTWNSLVAENVLEKKPRVRGDKINQRKLLPYCIEPVLIEEVAAAGAESGEAQAVRLFSVVSSRTSSASSAGEGNGGPIISLEAHLHSLFGRKRHGGRTDDDPFSASSADGDAPDAGFFADDVNVGRQKLLRDLYDYELEGAATEEGDQDDHQSAACWYFALLAHRLARKHGTFQNRPERRDPDAVFGQMFRAGLKVAAGAQAERDAKELRRLERQRREEQWRKHVDVVEHAEDGHHLKESRTREVLFSEFQKRVKRHQERRDAAEKAEATAFQRVGPHHDVTMLYSPSRARHMGLIRDFGYDNDDVLDLTTANVRLGEQPQSVLDIFDLREEMGHHMAKGIHVDTARLKRATHAAANEVAGLRGNETGEDHGAAAAPRLGAGDQGDHRSSSPERLSALERAAEAVGGSAADAASSWDAIMRCVTRAGRADFLAGEGGIQANPLGFGLMKLGDGNGKGTKTDATPKRRAIAVGERVLLRTLVFDPLVQLTHPEIAHLAYGCEHGSTLTVEDIDDGTGIVVVRESNPSKLGVAGAEVPRAAAGGTINDDKKKSKAAPGAPAPADNLVALPRGLLCGVKRSRGFVLPKVHEIVTVRNVVYPRAEVPVADAHRARLRVERVFSDRIFVRDVSAGGLLHTKPGFLLPIAYVNSDVRLEHGDEALLQDGAANYVGVADEDKTGPTRTLKSTAKQQDLDLLARPLTTDGRLFSSTCLFLPGTKVFLRPVVHEPPIPQWVSQKIRLHGWTCELVVVAADVDEHGMVSIALKHGDEPCRFASVPGGCVLDNTSLFGEQELMIGEEVLLRDILWDERILGMREVVEMLNAGGRLFVVSMLGRSIADDSDAGDLEGVPGLFAHDEDFVGESDFRAGFGVSAHHHRTGQPTKNFVVCEAQLAVTSGPTDFDLSDVAAVFSTSGQNQKSQTLSTRRRRIKLPLEYLEPKVMPAMKSALPLVQHGAELYLRPVVSSRSHQLSKIWRVLALRGELRYLGRGAQTTYSDGTTFTVIKVELWNAQGDRVRRELRLPDYLLLPPHGHDRMRRDYVRAHYGDATLRKLAFAKEIKTTDAAGAGASGRPQDQGTKVEQQSLPDSATESLSSELDEDDLVAKKLEVEVLMSANTNSIAAAMVDLPEEASPSSRTTRSTVQQFVRDLRERLAVPGRKVFAMRRDSGCWLEVRDGRMIIEKIAGPEVNRFLELFVPAQRSGTSTAILDKFLEKLETTREEPLSSADPHAEKPSEQDGNASKIIRAKAPSICLTVGDGMALPQLQIDGKRLFRVMLRNVVFADEKQMQPILERAKAGGELLAQVESDADAEAVEALLGKGGGGADDTPPDDSELPGDEDRLEGTGPEKPKSAFDNVASSVARESESSNKAGKPATDMPAEQSEQLRHDPSAVAESTKGSISERTIMEALVDVAPKGSEEPSASAPPNKGPARESAVADTSMGTMKERAAGLGALLAPLSTTTTGDQAAASPSPAKGKKSAPIVPQKGPARDRANPQGKDSGGSPPKGASPKGGKKDGAKPAAKGGGKAKAGIKGGKQAAPAPPAGKQAKPSEATSTNEARTSAAAATDIGAERADGGQRISGLSVPEGEKKHPRKTKRESVSGAKLVAQLAGLKSESDKEPRKTKRETGSGEKLVAQLAGLKSKLKHKPLSPRDKDTAVKDLAQLLAKAHKEDERHRKKIEADVEDPSVPASPEFLLTAKLDEGTHHTEKRQSRRLSAGERRARVRSRLKMAETENYRSPDSVSPEGREFAYTVERRGTRVGGQAIAGGLRAAGLGVVPSKYFAPLWVPGLVTGVCVGFRTDVVWADWWQNRLAQLVEEAASARGPSRIVLQVVDNRFDPSLGDYNQDPCDEACDVDLSLGIFKAREVKAGSLSSSSDATAGNAVLPSDKDKSSSVAITSVRLPDVEFQYGYAAVPGQGPDHALAKDIRTYPSLPDFLSAHPDALQRHGLRVCLRDLYFDSEGLIELRHHVARGAHLYVVDMITREKVTLSVVLLGDTKYHRYRKHHKRTGDVKKSAMFNPVELSSSFGDDYGGAATLTSGHGQPWMSGHVHDSELHSSSPPTTPEDEDHPDTAAGDSNGRYAEDVRLAREAAARGQALRVKSAARNFVTLTVGELVDDYFVASLDLAPIPRCMVEKVAGNKKKRDLSRTRKLRTEAAVEDSASKLHAHLHARGEFTDSEKNSEAGDRGEQGEVDLLQQVEERQLHVLQTEMRDVRDEIGARMSRLSRAAAEELGSQLAADPKALGAFEREKAALLAGSGVVARGGRAPSSAGGGATSGWEGVADVLASLQQKAATARRSSVGPPVGGGELELDEYPAQKPQEPKPQEQQASAGWDSDGSENQHLNVLPPETNLADHGVTKTMSIKGHRLFAPQERSGHPLGQEGTPDLSSGRNTNQSTPSRVFNNPKQPTPQEVRHNEKTSRSRQQLLEARKAKRRLQELEASIYALKADIETN
eukprot:g1104.t1